jgi:hypothetical protein
VRQPNHVIVDRTCAASGRWARHLAAQKRTRPVKHTARAGLTLNARELAAKDVRAEVAERGFYARARVRVARNRAARGRGARERAGLAAEEESAGGEEDVRGDVARGRGLHHGRHVRQRLCGAPNVSA